MLGVDVVRFWAAISVIWVHANQSGAFHGLQLSELGKWGTSFLNLIAGFFVVQSLARVVSGGALAFAVRRVQILYLPFLLWSGIYLLLRVPNYYLLGNRSSIAIDWNLLVYGTSYHLWFLPYLVGVTLISLPLVALALRSSRGQLVGGAAFGVAAIVLTLVPRPTWLPGDGSLASILMFIYTRGPAFLIGVAIGLWFHAGVRFKLSWAGAAVCGAVMLVGAAGVLVSEDLVLDRVFLRMVAIAGLMLAFAPWSGPVTTWIARLGSLGFGVYLCHVIFVEMGHTLSRAAGLPSGLARDGLVFVFAVVTSFALARFIRRTRSIRWMLP